MLKIINIEEDHILNAYNNLPKDYLESLKHKTDFNESLVGRYFIYLEKGFLPEVDLNNKPIFNNNNFFSISHKKDLVFVGAYNFPIGVDIEILKQRSVEILDVFSQEEYNFFLGKNIENFYRLWTIKESIVKLFLASVDEISNIKLDKIIYNKNTIDSLDFDCEFSGIYNQKKFHGFNSFFNGLFYSVSFLN